MTLRVKIAPSPLPYSHFISHVASLVDAARQNRSGSLIIFIIFSHFFTFMSADFGRWDMRERGYFLQCLLATIGSNFWGLMKKTHSKFTA